MRTWYPNAKPARFVIRRDGPIAERIAVDYLAGQSDDIVGRLAPDISLASTLRILPEDLEMEHEIARGGYGVVHLAKYRGSTVVAKQLLESESSTAYQELTRECWMMSFLHHVNIILLVGIVVEARIAVASFVPFVVCFCFSLSWGVCLRAYVCVLIVGV